MLYQYELKSTEVFTSRINWSQQIRENPHSHQEPIAFWMPNEFRSYAQLEKRSPFGCPMNSGQKAITSQKLQIAAGLTGQVLSVSEGLLLRLRKLRLVRGDKGLRSAILLFSRKRVFRLVRDDKGLRSVILLLLRLRTIRLVRDDKGLRSVI